MGDQVVHFEINALESRRAQQFYGKLFKWNIKADNPMNYGIVNTGKKDAVQGGIGQVEAGSQPFVTFYIGVDNPQKYLDHAVKLGGRIIKPLTVIPDMVTYAQFADPEGNIVGLVKNQPMPQVRTARRSNARNGGIKKSRKRS
jgi:predicted enzyme related to lactoylglutathione lyase